MGPWATSSGELKYENAYQSTPAPAKPNGFAYFSPDRCTQSAHAGPVTREDRVGSIPVVVLLNPTLQHQQNQQSCKSCGSAEAVAMNSSPVT